MLPFHNTQNPTKWKALCNTNQEVAINSPWAKSDTLPSFIKFY